MDKSSLASIWIVRCCYRFVGLYSNMKLLKLAGYGNLERVKRLIEQHHVHVNTTNDCNQTALYFACANGHREVARYLLEKGASVSLGPKPLIAAVRGNSFDCVKLLLEYNAYANCTNIEQESLMSYASQMRYYPIILLLLQYGAVSPESLGDISVQLLTHAKLENAKAIQKLMDENVINLTSESTFLAAFRYAFKRGPVELAERILSNESYSKIEQYYPEAAYYGAKNNWPAVVSKVVEKRVDINALTEGQTPLYVACEEQHESVVKILLNNGADPNVPNKLRASTDFSSPLQIAVRRGNATIVDLLLEKGAELNPPGEPLLHIACSGATEWKTAGGDGETTTVEHKLSMIVKLLLQQGVNVNAISDRGDTAVYRACIRQQLEVAQILLDAGADVNLTSEKLYPLIAACETGNAKLINLLLKAGADVNSRKNNEETCLHAVINSSVTDPQTDNDSTMNIIKSLLEAAVDVNACCSKGETALYRASEAGNEQIVRLLLEAGAEANGTTSRRSLYAACKHGHTHIVDLLLRHGADPNASSTSYFLSLSQIDSLPIGCAVRAGNSDIVNLLLKHRADVNKQDQTGKSALIYCFKDMTFEPCTPMDEKAFNILKSLLLAGGDVNMLSGHNGQNALHIASCFGMCDVMTELIRHGGDCNQLTSSGVSALDLACEKGHEGAVELLLKNGAKPDRKTSTTRSRHSRGCHSMYDSRYQPPMPVLCSAVTNGSELMVEMLLKYGADVNESDENGNTALHLATSNAVIGMLLNAGANVHARNNNGETALSVICETRQADTYVLEMLLNIGTDPNRCFLLHAACKNNDADTVRLLLAHGADSNLVKVSVSTRVGLFAIGFRDVKHIEPSPLCIACKNGNKDIVDCLLINGALVAFADSDGNTPLHFALDRLEEQANAEEYDPIVAALLKHDAPVNVVSDTGETPLYVACTKGHAGVVKQLLDSKAVVDLTRSSKKDPLTIACQKNFTNVAKMLLDRKQNVNVTKDQQSGADVDQLHGIADTALHVAVKCCRGHDNEAIRSLLKSGAEPNVLNYEGETPLYLACKPTTHVDTDIVQMLLEHGADPNICPPSRSSDFVLPPLTRAAIYSDNELAMLLIKYGAKVDHSDIRHGRTALHYVVDHMYCGRRMEPNDVSTAEKLLSAGADVNAVDGYGATPLYLACEKGLTEFVKLFLSYRANPNIETTNKIPIHVASRGHHYDAVKLLLEYEADVSVSDEEGKTALHYVLKYEPYQSNQSTDSGKGSILIHLLLDRGANVNAASKNGETPFYIACLKGLASIAKKMLECGAKVGGNTDKKLPLNAACSHKHMPVVQLLLANKANPNAREECDEDRCGCALPLHIAAANDNSELVELLLKHDANIDATDIGGNTALHHAVEYKTAYTALHFFNGLPSKSAVDILLETKADVNKVNNSGETPLYRAVSRELLDLVTKMLQVYGGNPNKGSPDKNPLVAACLSQKVKLVDTLLKHGADPNLASMSDDPHSKQRIPLFVAVKNDNSDIITSLLNAGANVNAMNHEAKTVLCFAAENMLGSDYYPIRLSTKAMGEKLSTIRLLLQHGANLNMLMPDGRTLLCLAVTALHREREDQCRKCVGQLLQLMVEYGAILQDSSLPENMHRQVPGGILNTLATFDGTHEFLVDMLRAGAGFQLLAFCCNAVATHRWKATSISLCQSAVLAGYAPSAQELQCLQRQATLKTDGHNLMEELVNWLNADREQIPSLLRQCRIVIRQQLSVAVHFQTILPAIEKLSLTSNLKLYLQFDGLLSEVDLRVNKELQTSETLPYNTQRSVFEFYDFFDANDYNGYVTDNDNDYYYDSDN